MIRNVIFDWSGTLVDDLPAVWEASNHVFRLAGVSPLTLEEFRAEFQLPYRGFYEKFVPHVPLEQLEVWFHSRFLECQDSVVTLPHARELLEFCSGQELRLFVLTTVHPKHFAAQATATGLGGFFEKVYAGVADKRVRIAELIADNLLDPEATVFIGDMQHDIETAKHGGIHSVAVLTGYNSLSQLREASPDLIVEHLGEFRLLLERQGLHLRPAPGPSAPRYPIPTVGALVFNDAGQFLLVRTNKWSNLWGIPGGKIEWGETSEAALRRELREETGLEVTKLEFVLAQDAIQPPEFYKDAHFILLNFTCCAPGFQIVRLNAEAQEFRWLTDVEARQLPLNTPTKVLLEAVRHRSHGQSPPKGSTEVAGRSTIVVPIV
ncbi:MAG TPA: NUDIX hydrolase [Verrucomicrobiales bacterium]|nr:NUDIX hydrolase [Verrucomicrobiales bacterium]